MSSSRDYDRGRNRRGLAGVGDSSPPPAVPDPPPSRPVGGSSLGGGSYFSYRTALDSRSPTPSQSTIGESSSQIPQYEHERTLPSPPPRDIQRFGGIASASNSYGPLQPRGSAGISSSGPRVTQRGSYTQTSLLSRPLLEARNNGPSLLAGPASEDGPLWEPETPRPPDLPFPYHLPPAPAGMFGPSSRTPRERCRCCSPSHKSVTCQKMMSQCELLPFSCSNPPAHCL
ncbi:hypothetical protein B0T26DRAFT_385784 [Lasiosphaeria miniovina]|uniref:Uncharacterized protein n=1 Tax=Lasiosphaeria miniovina TaxID=1954250 RepID=A0AA40AE28_9PEZI|nr:uncharacterized protein B0T26DRAFT_385784 [Lasiosphaeria miniovina]KAK0714135.1 hypothetical protein B0T26DRAFT_385784 [Lasiosphaeria miniovina]